NSKTNLLKWVGRKIFPSSPKMRKKKTIVPNGKDDKGTELFEIREVTVPNKFVEKRSLHSCGGGCSSVGMGSHKTNTNDSSSGHGHGHDAGHSCGSHSCGAHGCGASCGAGCGAGCGGCGA
ncbi:MAG: hypothetical protein OXU45_07435, partial [Candidatus Melainabacteria bacterium]|nr:hypothetical protein [Candidatus Melainabacteria bacterium]